MPALLAPTANLLPLRMDPRNELPWPLRLVGAAALVAAALGLSAPATGWAQPPPPGGPPAPTLAAAGDVACAPGDAETPTTCHQHRTAGLIRQLNPTVVAALGDVQYESGTLPEFQGSYEFSWGVFKPITRPAIGNHEYQTPGGAGYFDYFNGVGSFAGVAGERGRGYYSYPLGGWHVIVLNSNCQIVPCHTGSEQELWLRAELARWRSTCTLAYWHHPLFSSGPNRHDPNGMQTQSLWQALYEARADVVLNGHDHHYERFVPMAPDGERDEPTGIREIVVGTGGRSLYTFRRRSPNSRYRNSTDFGVLSMALRPTGYDWSFISSNTGAVLDSGTSACNNAQPEITEFYASRREFRVSSGATALVAATRRRPPRRPPPPPRTTTFVYRLSKLANVRLAITQLLPGRRDGESCVAPRSRLKTAPACTRRIPRGELERAGRPTRINRIVFTGRIGRRALRPGRYEARISAAAANGMTSRARTLAFTITR
jgi:calcineurin-like phosphoesterase family protein